jgi:hypothetical protein
VTDCVVDAVRSMPYRMPHARGDRIRQQRRRNTQRRDRQRQPRASPIALRGGRPRTERRDRHD